MKLIAASGVVLASIAQAKTIETIIQEMVDQVYQTTHNDDGSISHKVNVAPYWEADIKYHPVHNAFESKGSWGNGNGVITYEEEGQASDAGFSYSLTTEGNTKSSWWVDSLPADAQNDEFHDYKNFEFSGTEFKGVSQGKVNGKGYGGEFSVALGEMSQNKKRTEANLVLKRNFSVEKGMSPYWESMLPMTGESDININARVNNMCMQDPLNKKCNVKITLTGEHQGNDVGEMAVKYKVAADQASIKFSQNEEDLMTITLKGIHNHMQYQLYYSLASGEQSLVFQFIGMARISELMEAGNTFAAPFIAFFGAIQSGDDAARLLAYFDEVLNHAQGKNYFNFYPIVKASEFESQCLAKALEANSMQSMAEEAASMFNSMAEGLAAETAPVITDSRKYVQEVVSDEGRAAFNTWFTGITW